MCYAVQPIVKKPIRMSCGNYVKTREAENYCKNVGSRKEVPNRFEPLRTRSGVDFGPVLG